MSVICCHVSNASGPWSLALPCPCRIPHSSDSQDVACLWLDWSLPSLWKWKPFFHPSPAFPLELCFVSGSRLFQVLLSTVGSELLRVILAMQGSTKPPKTLAGADIHLVNVKLLQTPASQGCFYSNTSLAVQRSQWAVPLLRKVLLCWVHNITQGFIQEVLITDLICQFAGCWIMFPALQALQSRNWSHLLQFKC